MKTEILKIDGDASILEQPKIALLCSRDCPEDIADKTYELAKQFREKQALVISGFLSPVEDKCLSILLDSSLHSPGPAIWCPERGPYKQVPSHLKDRHAAAKAGRLVIVYLLFPEADAQAVKHRYSGAIEKRRNALIRNRWLADEAESVFVPHASAGGGTDKLCSELLEGGKPVFTIQHPANQSLLERGARPVEEMAF